jgi:hypothetical protein
MTKHLTQSCIYKKLTKNLISRLIKEVRKVIKGSSIDDKTKKLLLSSCEIKLNKTKDI